MDPNEAPDFDNPLRQVMVNTHSPYYIRYDAFGKGKDNVLAAIATTTKREGQLATTVRLRPMTGSWRAKRDGGNSVSVDALADYLRTPDDALVLQWNEDHQR